MQRDEHCANREAESLLDAVNTVLQRREYFREKKRHHRQKEKNEITRLMDEIRELQGMSDRLRRRNGNTKQLVSSDGALSWHIISSVFRQESRTTIEENKNLVQQYMEHNTLVSKMYQWIIQSESIPRVPTPFVCWQNIKLSNDPTARKLMKEWASQQMYHNTSLAFESFPKESNDNEFTDYDLKVRNSWLNVRDYSQLVFDAPMEVIVYMFRNNLIELSSKKASGMIEWTENSQLYQVIGSDGKYYPILHAYFHEADRCVMILRLLQDEECTDECQDYSMTWFDIRRIGTGRTITRTASTGSVMLSDTGPRSLAAIAKTLDFDLDEVSPLAAEETFQEMAKDRIARKEVLFRTKVKKILARVQLELSQLRAQQNQVM